MTHVVRLTADTRRFLQHFESGPKQLKEVQRLEKESDPKAGSQRRSLVSLRYAIAIRQDWLRRVPKETTTAVRMSDTAELTDYGRKMLAEYQPIEQ